MILTVTLNPLLERKFFYETVIYGGSNKTTEEFITAGGKGINVSRQLNLLHIDNFALTFAGGYSGKLFKKITGGENIKAVFVQTADETRNASVIIDKSNNRISTFFGKNTEITTKESVEFTDRLDKMIANCEMVVFSGSSPSSTTDYIFRHGIETANKLDKISVLDTYGPHLLSCINAVPAIMHNNLDELKLLYGISDENDVFKLLDELYHKGIKQVFVTNGSREIYSSNFDFHYKIKPPSVNQKDPTGSGDTFTAGIIYGWHNNLTFEETAIVATCLGAVNASDYNTCKASLEEVNKYRNEVSIKSVGKKIKIIDDRPL